MRFGWVFMVVLLAAWVVALGYFCDETGYRRGYAKGRQHEAEESAERWRTVTDNFRTVEGITISPRSNCDHKDYNTGWHTGPMPEKTGVGGLEVRGPGSLKFKIHVADDGDLEIEVDQKAMIIVHPKKSPVAKGDSP